MDIAEMLAGLAAEGCVLYEQDGQLRYRAPKGVLTPERLTWLRTNKGAVLDLLRKQEYGPGIVPDPAARFEPFPLTDVQSAYLVGRSNAFDYGGVACHGYMELALPLSYADNIEQAWNQLVGRHDMLRAVISADGYQRVLPEVPHYQVRREDPGMLEATREAMSHQVRRTDQWPLFDLRTTETDERLILHIAFDLLLCDYRSMQMLLGEFGTLCAGKPLPPAPEITFRDYVLGARGVVEGTRYKRDRDYWFDRIDALPPAPVLPLRDDARDAPPKFHRHELRLSAAQWTVLNERAGAAGVSASSALLQAFAETIGRWSHSPRFTLALTQENRLPLHADVAPIIGDFSSTSLFAVDLTEGESFAERVNRGQMRLWDDLDHRLCSGVEVMRELARRRSRAEALMPVTFTSTIGGTNAETANALLADAEIVYSITQTPQVWIDCQISSDADGLLANWDVREGVLPEGVTEDMFAAFADLVNRLVDDPAVWSAADPVELPAAQRDVIAAVNDTAAPRSLEPLHAGVVAQAERTPDRAAVITSSETLTYAELMARAGAVAAALAEGGCAPGDRVGIVVPKGSAQVVSVLGTLLAGGVYVPIDTTQPALRRNSIITDAGIGHVLTLAELRDSLDLPAAVRPVEVDSLAPRPGPAAHRPAPDDLAYVIYTSGSTGTPKGVMIGHAAARNTIDDINARFSVTEDDRVFGLAQLGFDLSVYDIFGPLSVGGALVLPDDALRSDPSHWAAQLAANGVTVWNSVPAQMQMLEEYLRHDTAVDVSRLRLAMLSGDWIPVTLPDAIRARIPGLEVISLGGATEVSIWSIYHPIEVVDRNAPSIPYGKPLANQTFHVLDSLMRECPAHVTGELYIGGVGLAQGYLGDPERTSERFVRHPVTGAPLYRTGDLGRRHPDGVIEFLGRVDRQVKLNGHRIELAEIEAALQTCPDVDLAAVAVHGEGPARRLVAFAEPTRTEPRALPDGLRRRAIDAGAELVRGIEDEHIVELIGLLDSVALDAMAEMLTEAGFFVTPEAVHTTEEINEAISVAPENHHLVQRWLNALSDEGKIVRDALAGTYKGELPVDPAAHREKLRRIDELAELTKWGSEFIRYLRVSEDNLVPLLRDDVNALSLLFPEGKFGPAEATYRDNLISRYNNEVVISAVQDIARAHTGPGPLRLLEIGAGVGGTSTVLIPALADLNVDYLFTDLSHFFLNAAKEHFHDVDWVRYGLFDLNRDYRAQGMAPNSFDVILLSNVMHNAKHVGKALDQIREMLAPGGWLVFIEATREVYSIMTSMEYKSGLTGFEDERREDERVFLARDRWLHLLGEAGGEVAFCLPEADAAISGIGPQTFAVRFKSERADVRQEQLIGHLAERLPSYMIPAEFQIVDRIPLTGNGKVDRARLDAWAGSGHGGGRNEATGEAPRPGLEQAIAALWSEVLPVEFIAREASFFDLGGDSLLVARLVTRLRENLPQAAEMDWDDVLRLVMNRPTIAALAAQLGADGAEARSATSVVRINTVDTGEPTRVLIHDGTGTLIPYRALIRELSDRVPMLGLVIDDPGLFLSGDPRTQVDELANRHTEALLAAGVDRVHLVGYCMGGLLAPELANRLTKAGVEVTGLTAISSYRVPYLVEDDLMAEYLCARLVQVDPVDLGYPPDELGIRDLIQAVLTRHDKVLPQGGLIEEPASALSEAGAQAQRYFQKLAERSQEDRLRAIGERMPASDDELGSVDWMARFLRIIKHSLITVATHMPTQYEKQATFVRQTGDAQIFPGMQADMTEYWQQVCVGGLRIVDVPGDHFTCMGPSNVGVTADVLLAGD
ncbi:amino acid adenylation domain-containing protein [Microbispora sp. NPDC088329]|uniref:amino acid adenylation domain-containing protein n=1 Tax=Microbispora sp. NPDC088329 TaxID=3154869 RepID=UPI003446307C